MKSIPLSAVRKDNSNITYFSRTLWKALRKERFKPLTKEKYDRYFAFRRVTGTVSFDPYDNLEFQMDLDRFKATLTEIQQQCFGYFLDGFPQKDIATMVGRSQGGVSKILHIVFREFKNFYEDPTHDE